LTFKVYSGSSASIITKRNWI